MLIWNCFLREGLMKESWTSFVQSWISLFQISMHCGYWFIRRILYIHVYKELILLHYFCPSWTTPFMCRKLNPNGCIKKCFMWNLVEIISVIWRNYSNYIVVTVCNEYYRYKIWKKYCCCIVYFWRNKYKFIHILICNVST